MSLATKLAEKIKESEEHIEAIGHNAAVLSDFLAGLAKQIVEGDGEKAPD